MNPLEIVDPSWRNIINSLSYQEPLQQLNEEILPNISYQPAKQDIFKVFETPVNRIKVVILGEDPYSTPGNAVGRAFAVNEDRKIPASLRIISNEIDNSFSDGTTKLVTSFDQEWRTLEHWQEQGVFLLNTALTVETGNAGSHLKYWEEFTKRIISYISSEQPCIWVLWGRKAQNFIPHIKGEVFRVSGYDKETIKLIPGNSHMNYILTAPHPAAETYAGGNAGFYKCNHFLFINEILIKTKQSPINW